MIVMKPLEQIMNKLGLKDYAELAEYIHDNPADSLSIEFKALIAKYVQIKKISLRAIENEPL